jgi:hypothetical protein
MPPLTLTVLAVLLRMQGPDVEIYSDNQGVDNLLAQVREQLKDQTVTHANSGVRLAVYSKEILPRRYYKEYWKVNASQAIRPTTPKTPTAPTAPTAPTGGRRR